MQGVGGKSDLFMAAGGVMLVMFLSARVAIAVVIERRSHGVPLSRRAVSAIVALAGMLL
jgi:hypothetical protein